jgi:tetratricopeptide (TPR) repeat protein
MGFFKKIFGGHQEPAGDHKALAEKFDFAWQDAQERFGKLTGVGKIELKLRHPETGAALKPHEGLNGSFEDWKAIQSVWDQQLLLLDLLLNSVQRALKPWHITNGLVAIRQPDQAEAFISDTPAPDGPDEFAMYCEAYARALQYSQKPKDAVAWARKAYEAASDHTIIRLRLADVLFMTGECEEANKLYSEMMQNLPVTPTSADVPIQTMFAELFSVLTGGVPSPVLAIEIGEKLTDAAQAAEFWQLAEVEFYDSPYFRMHHAYHLAKQGDIPRAIAKLGALVQEMPWLREAHINLDQMLQAVDPDGTKMSELRQLVRQRIQENGWTTDGMRKIDIL